MSSERIISLCGMIASAIVFSITLGGLASNSLFREAKQTVLIASAIVFIISWLVGCLERKRR